MTKTNLLRVTQMNAIFLDTEIEKSLRLIIQEACKHLSPGLIAPIEPEINLLLRLGILKNSVLNKGSTFGQQLLNIQYENMTCTKAILYLLLNCLDYIKTRCEFSRPSHYMNNKLFKIYVIFKILDFINISAFLKTGTKPRLTERILGLNQVYRDESSPRTFQSKYMTRELLWNGFIEIIVYLLPLINYYKLKRFVRYYNPLYKRKTYTSVIQGREFTVNTKCAHCNENPILPHHMGCSHIFCYVCLKGNLAADSKYECPICEHRNPNVLCDRVNK
ncbi:peroxisome biogenesis factor 2-like [Rhynchophorus ferrugineus]|uniref:peroxisome biogenesis factor 2-like n=1 Tax=Rhynchophorus ferrugineus TaxID=354439 RepID=UPI003FCDD7E7